MRKRSVWERLTQWQEGFMCGRREGSLFLRSNFSQMILVFFSISFHFPGDALSFFLISLPWLKEVSL